MPAGSVPYTLVGFAPELDWRPLHFVRPIPLLTACSACGLVHTKMALLPCLHVLCEPCYDQCAENGERLCPLDGLQCPGEHVEWKEWPADELLKRQVVCWNEESGCTAVMAASGIFQHFRRDCGHHTARCPKCSASVLSREVCAHLRSNCADTTAPLASGSGGHALRREESPALTSNRGLEEQPGEIKALLERLVTASSEQGDRLREISHGQNCLTETLKHELSQATRQITASNEEAERSTIDNLSTRMGALEETLKCELSTVKRQGADEYSRLEASIDAVKAEAKEISQKTLDSIGLIVGHNKLQVERCEFFVKRVLSLKEKALIGGWAVYSSERVYLRGYCISPGIELIRDGGYVTLHLRYELYKGDMDHVVQWPFEHRMRLSVIHPIGDAKCQIEGKPWRISEYNRRPSGSSNQSSYFRCPSYKLSDLIRYGYVYEDQLRVTFELLQ